MSEETVSLHLPEALVEGELEIITARRQAAGLDTEPLLRGTAGRPSVKRELTGLALSGGGIRSSTFGIGVIQALASAGLFQRADYISTVSGGGYTGSMLSSLLRDAPDPSDLPLAKPEGREEPPVLQHLRNGSNYLDPGGLLNTMRLPAVVGRGLLLNLLLLLPYIMLLVTATELIYEHGRVLEWRMSTAELGSWLRTDLWALLVIAPALLLYYWVMARLGKGKWKLRDRYERGLGAVLLLLIAVALLVPLLHLVGAAIELPLKGPLGLEAWLSRWFTWSVWAIATGVSIGLYAVVKASQHLSRIAGKVILFGAGVAGPMLILALYLFLVVAQADSPFIKGTFPELDQIRADRDTATVVRLRRNLVDQFLRKGIAYEAQLRVPVVYCPAPPADSLPRMPEAWLLAKPTSVEQLTRNFETEDGRRLGQEMCRQPNNAIEDSHYYRVAHLTTRYEVIGAKLRFGGKPSGETLLGDWLFVALAGLLLVFNYLFLDVNQSSLHGFYRDRLSRLYLIRRRKDGSVEPNDDQKLTTLNQPGSVAPYHIINTTLNLQGVTVESSRGRQSDFFFFTKRFCGGPHTGYCRTEDMEQWDDHVNLGTAMAISAAAAAPNMGSTTVKPLVFVLTMLNLRLGYWLPNPKYVRRGRSRPSFLSLRPRSLYLLREAMGALDADHALVNVSDGGHLENLAIYELLRRRCKVIIAVDGEADPNLTFNGLVTLMRLAKIDLGVDINIDLHALKLNPERFSTAHYAVGTIDYGVEDGEPQTGHLIYVKSSMTNDEDPFIKKYRADHPTYPHETTADQFFDEVQFEAYRALGNHVGDRLVRDDQVLNVLALP